MDKQPGLSEPSWRLRRRAIFGGMIFGMMVVTIVLLRWDDTRLAETLAYGGFGLIASVIGIYSGAAAYQDVRLWPQRQSDYAAPVADEGEPHV